MPKFMFLPETDSQTPFTYVESEEEAVAESAASDHDGIIVRVVGRVEKTRQFVPEPTRKPRSDKGKAKAKKAD